MDTIKRPAKDQVLEANIRFHTALAKHYEQSQPYFDKINTKRVTDILHDLAQQAGDGALLDIGCGTGFICNLGQSIFKKVVGLDATPAMLSLVEPGKNHQLVLADVRHIPSAQSTFNVCTAYGVLHHLEDLRPVIEEIYRILAPGGKFYSDEDPNRDYFQFFANYQADSDVTELISNELHNLTNKPREMKEQFDVEEEITQLAEYQKMSKGGMNIRTIRKLFLESGFADVQIELRWFLGQATIKKQRGLETERSINDYLTAALPLSTGLFKYFKLIATKGTT